MKKVLATASFQQAEMIRTALRENGIETFLENEGSMSIIGVPLPMTPLILTVSDDDAESAAEMIAEILKKPEGQSLSEASVQILCACGKMLEVPGGQAPPEECPWCGRGSRGNVAAAPEVSKSRTWT